MTTTNNEACTAVHTYTMKDGNKTLVTTTWHDTKKAAHERIASVSDATFRKVIPENGVLGKYRAVTWQATVWQYQHDTDLSKLHEGTPTDARGLQLRKESGYTHVNMGDGWLQINVAIRKVQHKTLTLIPVVS